MQDEFLSRVVASYQTFAPQAWRAYRALDPDLQSLDHVAFRTFDRGPHTLETLEAWLVEHGYAQSGTYSFPDKHVRAKSFSKLYRPEPGAEQFIPRVFVSELLVDEMPLDFRHRIDAMTAAAPRGLRFPWCTVPWAFNPYHYSRFLETSEYAAWVAANGLMPNHLTVNVGSRRIADVVNDLERQGFHVSSAGGKVKGGPHVLLEQGSTIADVMNQGSLEVATAYCEFAARWPDPKTGLPFDGFVEPSAARIFESTDLRKAEEALAIIKPDAVRRDLVVPVLREILKEGLEPIEMKRVTMTRRDASLLYQPHEEKEFFEGLVNFMMSGESLVIKLWARDCALRLRKVVQSVRAQYATSTRENVIHGSDSPEAGTRESRIFFF